MGSETDDRGDDDCVKTSPKRKRNPEKTPGKVHKAAREKLRRDQMNELFTDLGRKLGMSNDVDHMNTGKASVLSETIRLFRELLIQVESLKKENVMLLSESNYLTAERGELQEETSTLEAQVKMLRREISERPKCGILGVSGNFATKLAEDHAPFPPVGCAPLFVMPLARESQGFSVPFPEVNDPKLPSSVSRPRPRYPSSSDSWPSHILAQSD